jgi:hypothetical protein
MNQLMHIAEKYLLSAVCRHGGSQAVFEALCLT